MTLQILLYDTFGRSLNKSIPNFDFDSVGSFVYFNAKPHDKCGMDDDTFEDFPLGSYYIEQESKIHVAICENRDVFNSMITGWGLFLLNIIKISVDYFRITDIRIYSRNINHPINTTNTLKQRLQPLEELGSLRDFPITLM